jgi:transposase
MIQTVRRLERQIKRLKKENRRLTAENALLRKENKVLKRKISEQEKKRTSRKRPRVKANPSGKRKKPGRKPGFKGSSRKIPDHVDEVVDVILPSCPCCGALLESYAQRERYVEDIVIVRPCVTKYIIHRYYCSHCEINVSAVPDDVIPHCMLGINVMLLVAYQKFELHLSYNKIRKNLEMCFGLKTTNAALCNAAKLVSTYYRKEFDTINPH